jgi:hypothetical protein
VQVNFQCADFPSLLVFLNNSKAKLSLCPMCLWQMVFLSVFQI